MAEQIRIYSVNPWVGLGKVLPELGLARANPPGESELKELPRVFHFIIGKFSSNNNNGL